MADKEREKRLKSARVGGFGAMARSPGAQKVKEFFKKGATHAPPGQYSTDIQIGGGGAPTVDKLTRMTAPTGPKGPIINQAAVDKVSAVQKKNADIEAGRKKWLDSTAIDNVPGSGGPIYDKKGKLIRKGIPKAYRVPSALQGRFGKHYLTNKGAPDFEKLAATPYTPKLASGLAPGEGGAVYGTPRESVYGSPRADGSEGDVNLIQARMDLQPKRGIPKMDLSSPGGVIQAMNMIAPMAMETGAANARARRAKAALSMGVDAGKIEKLAQETLYGIPQDIKTKQAAEKLSEAKTATEKQKGRKDALNAAMDAAMQTGIFEKETFDDVMKRYEGYSGGTGGASTVTDDEIEALLGKYPAKE